MSNSLSAVHPELIAEWSEKNLPLTPDSITSGSNKIVGKSKTAQTEKLSADFICRELFCSVAFAVVKKIRFALLSVPALFAHLPILRASSFHRRQMPPRPRRVPSHSISA